MTKVEAATAVDEPTWEWLGSLACPVCDTPGLQRTELHVHCVGCGRSYPVTGTAPDFVLAERLDTNAHRERSEHSRGITMQEALRSVSDDRAWFLSDYYSLDRHRPLRLLAEWLKPHADDQFVFLGAGGGRELDYLKLHLPLRRLLVSDISMELLKVAQVRLRSMGAAFGCFAADLDNAPPVDAESVLVVVNALHHTSDMHGALDKILARGPRRVFIVEPLGNGLIRFLGRFGLAIRPEYSGVRPGRLDLQALRTIAKLHGYDVRARTLWSFPPSYFEALRISNSGFARSFLFGMDALSSFTAPFELGNMAVVSLAKT